MDPDHFAVCQQPSRGCEARWEPAKILDPSDVAGCVARHDVFIAIFVPVEPLWRDQCAELDVTCFLLKVLGLMEYRHAVDGLARVLDECHAAVFVPDHQVPIAVPVPVHRRWCDHLQIHGDWLSSTREAAAFREFGR